MSKRAKTVAIVAAILVLSGWLVSQRNALVTLDESVEAAWSEVDNQLQRRSDLIPNLVNTVQGFMQQEQQIFSDIANARARLAGAGTVGETAEGYEELQGAVSRLLMVVENYPVLQSNQNFIRLQDELAGTENRIAVARNRYNDAVRRFNTRIRQFPASMLASRFGLTQREYFEISEQAREVPRVEFGGQGSGN